MRIFYGYSLLVLAIAIGQEGESGATAKRLPPPSQRPEVARASKIPAIERGTRLTVQTPSALSMSFIFVPPGTFVMGDPVRANEKVWEAALRGVAQNTGPRGGKPLRTTTITRQLYFAETKVTTAQFCVFLNETDSPGTQYTANKWCTIREEDGKFRPVNGTDHAPASTVTFAGAIAYCRWLSARTGLACRLPTEAEWEWAARGPEGRRYPWGDTRDGERAKRRRLPEPASVFTYEDERTPEGLYGMMSGTLAEWCQDWYEETYDLKEKVDPGGPSDGRDRVIKGRGPEVWVRARGPATGPVEAGIYAFRVVIDVTPVGSKPDDHVSTPSADRESDYK